MNTGIVVLIGPMGAGKTSIGKKLAKLRGWQFTDTDRMIETTTKQSIAQLFADHGEPVFRQLEREAVADAVREGGVVALGGGAVMAPETRELLREIPVIFLTVSPEAVAHRVQNNKRPLLATEDPLAAWQRIFAEREDQYREVADLTVDTSRVPMTKIAVQLSEWLDTSNPQETP